MTPREVLGMWRGGLSYAEIALILGVSRQRVGVIIAKTGVGRKREVRRRQRNSWNWRRK